MGWPVGWLLHWIHIIHVKNAPLSSWVSSQLVIQVAWYGKCINLDQRLSTCINLPILRQIIRQFEAETSADMGKPHQMTTWSATFVSWGQNTINPTAWLRAQIQQRSATILVPHRVRLAMFVATAQWQDVEEDIDPNKLGALAMEAMLSWDLSFFPNRIERHIFWTSKLEGIPSCSRKYLYIQSYIYIYILYII